MHLLIKKYIIDGNQYLSFDENLKGDNFCIEVQFISISNNFLFELDKILEKYQIKITNYLDGTYIKDFGENNSIEPYIVAYKIQNGFNYNEVELTQKNIKNKGFFEKFFQLFS